MGLLFEGRGGSDASVAEGGRTVCQLKRATKYSVTENIKTASSGLSKCGTRACWPVTGCFHAVKKSREGQGWDGTRVLKGQGGSDRPSQHYMS